MVAAVAWWRVVAAAVEAVVGGSSESQPLFQLEL